MKTFTYLLLTSLMAAGCQRSPKDDGTRPAPLFPQPKAIEANPKNGYAINPVTGDTIKPLINSLGDTLKTGVPIPAKGKVILSDSVAKPKSFKVTPQSRLIPKNAHPNRIKIPEHLPTFPVDQSKLRRVKLGEGNPDFVLTNSTGDSIATAVALPAKGKTVATTQPKPSPALPPAFKDAAVANIPYLDVDQGMNSSYVLSILEDKRGNLWFGTDGGGVSMYNGESFVHFTEKEGLSNNTVWSILEDTKGNLWFGTLGGGLSMHNGTSFVRFTEQEGLSKQIVLSMLEDRQGNLWVGTEGGGVSKYDGESFVHFTEKEGLSNNYVMSILEDQHGNLWFGSYGGGVSMYDGVSFVHFTEKEGLSNNTVWAMLEDKQGNLWFGTDGGGVCRYNGTSFVHFTEKEGLSNNIVRAILEDQQGNLWFGTYGGGASMYDGASFVHFTEKEGLSNNIVRSILQDKSGNLWFGTYGGGISRYNGASFLHFTEKEGLSDNLVRSILEDKQGNLWFSTLGGGLSIYNGASFLHLTEKEGLNNNRVLSILEDTKGILWFGTYGSGVSMYTGETFVHFTEKEGLSKDIVRAILEDKQGNLWFGTFGGGASRYNGTSFVHFTEKEGLNNNYVVSILEDTQGNLWFGTYGGGVSKYNGASFLHFTEKEGLSNNYVLAILEDKKGNLWFGTYGGGVSMYNGETFVHFTEKEGLSNNTVWALVEDAEGRVWISTEKGLNYISPRSTTPNGNSANTPQMSIHSFQKGDGLKGLDFSGNALIDAKNRAWWGGGKGLEMLDLNRFKPSEGPPSVRLTQLDINEQFIDYRNMTDSLAREIEFNEIQKFENYPLNLTLPHHKNHLTFHFVGMDWLAPHKIKYSYRILGLNDKWSAPSKENKAEYRNLPYGIYTFQVRAMGASQVWSEAFEYTFAIRPPWWQTWWAYLGYILLLLFALSLFSKWRERKLILEKERLEKTVEERTAEVVAEKKEADKQREQAERQKEEADKQRQRSDDLLLNILPEEVAQELKEKGSAQARQFEEITVLFTDFKDFTRVSESMSPADLVEEMHACFKAFDGIMEKHGIEKIKTIGDAYMAAGGLPVPTDKSVKHTVLAALEMQDFINQRKAQRDALGQPAFEMRVGIHTGPVVAGIVGVKKFQYDIWGDTVNTASRMESAGEVGKVNISKTTYNLVKDLFTCTHRGKIEVKNKGELDMYFVEGTIRA